MWLLWLQAAGTGTYLLQGQTQGSVGFLVACHLEQGAQQVCAAAAGTAAPALLPSWLGFVLGVLPHKAVGRLSLHRSTDCDPLAQLVVSAQVLTVARTAM